jgi:hypothetical protein
MMSEFVFFSGICNLPFSEVEVSQLKKLCPQLILVRSEVGNAGILGFIPYVSSKGEILIVL